MNRDAVQGQLPDVDTAAAHQFERIAAHLNFLLGVHNHRAPGSAGTPIRDEFPLARVPRDFDAPAILGNLPPFHAVTVGPAATGNGDGSPAWGFTLVRCDVLSATPAAAGPAISEGSLRAPESMRSSKQCWYAMMEGPAAPLARC